MRIAWEKIEAENLQLKKRVRELEAEVHSWSQKCEQEAVKRQTAEDELVQLRQEYNQLDDLYEEVIDDLADAESQLDELRQP